MDTTPIPLRSEYRPADRYRPSDHSWREYKDSDRYRPPEYSDHEHNRHHRRGERQFNQSRFNPPRNFPRRSLPTSYDNSIVTSTERPSLLARIENSPVHGDANPAEAISPSDEIVEFFPLAGTVTAEPSRRRSASSEPDVGSPKRACYATSREGALIPVAAPTTPHSAADFGQPFQWEELDDHDIDGEPMEDIDGEPMGQDDICNDDGLLAPQIEPKPCRRPEPVHSHGHDTGNDGATLHDSVKLKDEDGKEISTDTPLSEVENLTFFEDAYMEDTSLGITKMEDGEVQPNVPREQLGSAQGGATLVVNNNITTTQGNNLELDLNETSHALEDIVEEGEVESQPAVHTISSRPSLHISTTALHISTTVSQAYPPPLPTPSLSPPAFPPEPQPQFTQVHEQAAQHVKAHQRSQVFVRNIVASSAPRPQSEGRVLHKWLVDKQIAMLKDQKAYLDERKESCKNDRRALRYLIAQGEDQHARKGRCGAPVDNVPAPPRISNGGAPHVSNPKHALGWLHRCLKMLDEDIEADERELDLLEVRIKRAERLRNSVHCR